MTEIDDCITVTFYCDCGLSNDLRTNAYVIVTECQVPFYIFILADLSFLWLHAAATISIPFYS